MSETTGLRAVNNDQLASSVQRIATTIAGAIAARGYIGDSEVELWGGIIAALAFAAWGFFTNRDANLINTAVNVPAVESLTIKSPALTSVRTRGRGAGKIITKDSPYR
jgi:hypothetical protein